MNFIKRVALMSIKKFCKKHSDQLIIGLILLALYIAEAAIRPLAAPGEYIFICKLHTLFPDFPESKLLFRLPSILITFAGAAAVYSIGKAWNFKHPGSAAGFYLLFPPTFYFGTAATLVPLLSTGALIVTCGVQKFAGKLSIQKCFFTIFSVFTAIIVAALYIRSDFYEHRDFRIIAAAATALILLKLFQFIGKDRERVGRLLDRFSRAVSVILLLLAILVLTPVLLRHFKVDFPPEFAFYRRGERIIRPLLMLMLPLIWFNLAREAKKISRKLLLIGGAFAFLLFTLPLTLPWHIQKEIYWHYRFESIARELPSSNTICFAEKRDIPFFKEFFKFPIKTIGQDPGEIKPEDLEKHIETL